MLERCPRCDYSLRGLPADHACPECGLRYDARSRVWRVVKPKAILIGVLVILVSMPTMIRQLFRLPAYSPASQALLALAIVLWFACMAWIVTRAITIYRGGQFIAALPEGVLMRLRTPDAVLLAWSDVASVTARTSGGRLCAKVALKRGGKEILLEGLFVDQASLQALLSTADAYLRAADAACTPAGPDDGPEDREDT